MVTADVDLELRQQLKEAGNLLSDPPALDDELLHLLDQTERLLGMVDQSPDKQMQEALIAPIKALVNDRLLKHSNMDVKVSVANCICEITRITAPEAPYSDGEMKSFFQLVVSSFEDLRDESSRSYNKRLSILDTVYKVKSCVIMLDLECDALIVTMFDHFLKSVRDHHCDKGFSIMKNIMALVIEESEDISDDLLNPLLASLKINNEGVLPVARKLGEEVIKTSADKLRPYLKQAVTRLNDSLDNYSQVLTSVCMETTKVNERNDDSALVLHKTDEPELAPALDDAVKVNENEEGADDKGSKKCEEAIGNSEMTETEPELTSHPIENDSVEPTNSADRKDVKSEHVAESSKNGSPLKESESINAGPVSDGVGVIKKGIRSKKKNSGQTAAPEVTSDAKTVARKKTLKAEVNKRSVDTELSEKVPESMSDIEMIPLKRVRKKTIKAEETEKILNEKVNATNSESKQGKRLGKKVVTLNAVATSGSDNELLKKSTKKLDIVDSGSTLVESTGKKVDAVDSESTLVESTGQKVGGKRSVSKKGKKIDGGDAGVKKSKQENDSENVDEKSDSDDKLIKLSAKKGSKKSSVVKSSSKKTSGKSVEVEEKTQVKSVSDDDGMDVPLKSALKTATKRKRSVAKPKVKYDGSLIDQKVKVWWPDDEMYYEGVVASFDATEKKHKVLYLDGEEEILNLKDEKWEIIQEYSVQYTENIVEVETQITVDVPEPPVKKKSKKTSGEAAQRSVSGLLSKPGNKSVDENEKTEDDERKFPTVSKISQEPIVYRSKGRKNKMKAAEVELKKDDDNVSSEMKPTSEDLKLTKDNDAAEELTSVVEKSTGTTLKIGLKTGQKRKTT